jgi:hypothetical protein
MIDPHVDVNRARLNAAENCFEDDVVPVCGCLSEPASLHATYIILFLPFRMKYARKPVLASRAATRQRPAAALFKSCSIHSAFRAIIGLTFDALRAGT